jgi:phage FluMu protein Com
MTIAAAQPDILRCKHCGREVAQIPRLAIVHRFKLCCPHCQYENIIRPPKRMLDEPIVISYTESVPA